MPKAKQFSVRVENKPGELARLAAALGQAGVNIRDYLACETKDASLIRFVVDSPAKAKRIFDRLAIDYTEEEVLVLELRDRPGALGEAAGRLAQAGINIDYAYGTFAPGARRVSDVLAVADLAGATKALRGLKT